MAFRDLRATPRRKLRHRTEFVVTILTLGGASSLALRVRVKTSPLPPRPLWPAPSKQPNDAEPLGNRRKSFSCVPPRTVFANLHTPAKHGKYRCPPLLQRGFLVIRHFGTYVNFPYQSLIAGRTLVGPAFPSACLRRTRPPHLACVLESLRREAVVAMPSTYQLLLMQALVSGFGGRHSAFRGLRPIAYFIPGSLTSDP